jgi:cystathionine gamma-lyase
VGRGCGDCANGSEWCGGNLRSMGEATRVIRATLTRARAGEPLHAGPVFAAPFHVAGDPASSAYTYGRSHNPTWTELEGVIGGLEVAGGEPAGVRVFGSGLAAVAAAFGAVLRPGDTVVMQAGAYFMARQLLEEVYGPAGVTVRLVEAAGIAEELEGARLVWLETPSNPEMSVVDIRRVAVAAHKVGALVAVDNTTATPLGQRPLELGADLSVCSDSKAMCGHSDLLMGHVATRDAELLKKVDRQRTITGGIAGPMEAWLMLRSLATLPLRLEKMSANALTIAEFLAGRAEVSGVVYPGLKGHPGHEVARAQMKYFGPVLGFTLASKDAAERFLEAAELLTEATSFGGISTSAERRSRWGHDDVAAGFIRMSAGCEDVEDLIEDIGRALKQSIVY